MSEGILKSFEVQRVPVFCIKNMEYFWSLERYQVNNAWDVPLLYHWMLQIIISMQTENSLIHKLWTWNFASHNPAGSSLRIRATMYPVAGV